MEFMRPERSITAQVPEGWVEKKPGYGWQFSALTSTLRNFKKISGILKS